MFPSAKNYSYSDAKKSFIASCPNSNHDVAALFWNYVSSMLPGTVLFPYSYSSASIKVKNLLRKANLDDSYTLHSFRIGAVSAAVNSGKISDSDVQLHARWCSIENVYRYRCMSLDSQLKASRLLLLSNL